MRGSVTIVLRPALEPRSRRRPPGAASGECPAGRPGGSRQPAQGWRFAQVADRIRGTLRGTPPRRERNAADSLGSKQGSQPTLSIEARKTSLRPCLYRTATSPAFIHASVSARSSRHSGADLSNNATESSYEWGGALHRAAPDPTLQRPPESRLRLSTVLGSDRPAHVPCAASAQEPRSEFASSQQAVASGEAPAEPPVHTNERFAGRAARDCFIADSAAASALLLRAVGDAKRKPPTGVERQLDDRSWVQAATRGSRSIAPSGVLRAAARRARAGGR